MSEPKDIRITVESSESETRVPLIFQSIVELVLGVFLVVYRDKTSSVLFIVTGALMVGYGIFDLIAYLTNNRPYTFRRGLASGVLITVVGIAFIVQAQKLGNLIAIVFGALLIMESVVNCRRAVLIREMGFEKWYIPFIVSSLVLLLGIFICIFPETFGDILSVIMGCAVIFEGLIDLWAMLTIIRLRKRLADKLTNNNNNQIVILDKK